ncbi:phage portal protein [Pleomorphomonas carboxyditropha]|uniref:Phage portal protein n=1 Tax=Pleomorphomonas carboxyditropha TaxID=2023338 RepID=A0A2G9WYB8_9HYPH|nr:phage portal protein [Pleomorphomonas carboxyditropha]PIO99664.1 phage portal protein [Pleomorphomonas carboxyditropha]
MFNWLRRLRPAAETRALDLENGGILAAMVGRVSSAGITVTPDTALMVTAASCAIRLIAETVATLPILVHRRLDGGGKERATDHPVYRLLHDAPNDFQSSYDLKLKVMIDALTRDAGGLIFINRVGNEVRELIRIPPAKWSVSYDDLDVPTYSISDAIGSRKVGAGDVIHIRASLGKSPLTLATESIGLTSALQSYAGRLMKNGPKAGAVLSAKNDLTPAALKNLRDAVIAQTTGDAEGSLLVLPSPVDFNAASWTPEALELVDQRRFLIDEVARAFRTPSILLHEYGRATWANSVQMRQDFLTFSILPWLEAWIGAILRVLFSSEERDQFDVEFLVDDLLRADLASRADAYGKLITARVLNPNECRAMEGRAPYAGGDEFLNPNTTKDGGADNGAST